jgi:hypothetical protein
MKKLLITTTIISALALSQPAFAQTTTTQDELAKIQVTMQSISEMVTSGKLDNVHAQIEKIEVSAKLIKEKSGFDGDKKTRLEAALKQMDTQLGKVHSASDSKDVEKTKSEFKKAEAALKLVESNFK